MKAFRSDNGEEYIFKTFIWFLNDNGMEKQTSIMYTPQHTNHTIVEMAMSMLRAQNLYKSFWMEAVANVVYIQNQCPMRMLDSISLEEA